MRNSLLPLILMLIIAAGVVALIRPGPPRGAGGPDLFPGIYRLAKREVVKSLEPGALVISNAVTVAGERDRRALLAEDAWGHVVIASEDGGAAGRALVLGLAEELTRRGCVAVIDTPDSAQPIPIPCYRRLRVSTLRESPPAQPGADYQASVRVVMDEVRPPDGHPAARLLPAGGQREVDLAIEHRNRQGAGAPPPWDRWYATVGRSMAVEVIAALSGVAALVERVDPDAAQARRAEPTPPPLSWHGLPHPDWPRLPEPPQRDPARWYASFQHELVRGWIGGIRGTTHVASSGQSEPSIAPFARQLARGTWTESEAGDGQRLWTREAAGETTSITARPNANGWDLVLWQERAKPAETFAGWQARAEGGDAPARHLLGAHLACAAVPADLRATAAAWLAPQEPDLIEQAQLPGTPPPAAAWLAHDLGRSPAPGGARPAATVLTRGQAWSGRARPTALSIDGQPLWLLVRGAAPGLLVLPATAAAPAATRPVLTTLAVEHGSNRLLPATVALAGGRLEVTRTADTVTITWR